MGEHGKFDELVSDLTAPERQELLKRIRTEYAPPEGEDLEIEPEQVFDIDLEYERLSLWERIWLAIVQLFRGETRTQILEEWLLRNVALDLQKRAPEYVNTRRRVLLPRFADLVAELAKAVKPLAPYVQAVADGNRAEFVVFYVAFTAPHDHERIAKACDPERIDPDHAYRTERDLKRALKRSTEDAIGQIDEQTRRSITSGIHQIDQLNELVRFSFDSLLSLFESPDQEERERQCPFEYAVRPLDSLTTLLTGLSGRLHPTAMQAMAIFHYQRLPESERGTVEESVTAFNEILADAVHVIRKSVTTIPLVSLLRLIQDDLWASVKKDVTTSDWLGYYRAFWQEHLAAKVNAFIVGNAVEEIRNEAYALLESHLPPLHPTHPNFPEDPESSGGTESGDLAESSTAPPGLTADPRRHSLTLLILSAAIDRMWPQATGSLKMILVNGEFYKPGNRAQFNDAYEEMNGWRKRLDPILDTLRLTKKTDRELTRRIQTTISLMHTPLELMTKLIGGILYAQAGSTYDTLANLGQISGRRNAEFLEELKEQHQNLEALMRLIDRSVATEKLAAEHDLEIK